MLSLSHIHSITRRQIQHELSALNLSFPKHLKFDIDGTFNTESDANGIYLALGRLLIRHPVLTHSPFFNKLLDLFRQDAAKLQMEKREMGWDLETDFPGAYVDDVPVDFYEAVLIRDEWDSAEEKFVFSPSFLDVLAQQVFSYSKMVDALMLCPAGWLRYYCELIADSPGHLFCVAEEKLEEAQRLFDAACLYGAMLSAQENGCDEEGNELSEEDIRCASRLVRRMYHPWNGMRIYESLREKSEEDPQEENEKMHGKKTSSTKRKRRHHSSTCPDPDEEEQSRRANSRASTVSPSNSTTSTTPAESTADTLSTSDSFSIGDTMPFQSSYFRKLHKRWQKISDWQFNSFQEYTGEEAYDGRFNLFHLTCRSAKQNTYTSVHLRDLRSYATHAEYTEFLVGIASANPLFGLSTKTFDKLNDMVTVWVNRADGSLHRIQEGQENGKRNRRASRDTSFMSATTLAASLLPNSLVLSNGESEAFHPLAQKTARGTSSSQQRPAAQHMTCSHCGKMGPDLLLCSRCKGAAFCGRSCQKLAWPNHKKECVAVAELH